MNNLLTLPLIILTLILLVVVVLLFCILLVLGRRVKVLEQRYNKFLRGRDVQEMEDIIISRFAEIDRLRKDADETADLLKEINESYNATYQKFGIVKYDAFEEMGGNLSFAFALLDHQDNGVIINSLHGREGCYTYAKEIVKGNSYVMLGNEEKEALEKAKQSNNYMA